jgi:hypothetical protein
LFFIRKDKNLTAPLTLVLSRKGREENKKNLTESPHPCPLPQGERFDEWKRI